VPAMALPLGLLFVVKVGSLIFGKGFDRWDVILAVTGIATAVTTQSLIGVLHRRLARSSPPPGRRTLDRPRADV